MIDRYRTLRHLPRELSLEDERAFDALYERMRAGSTSKRTWRGRLNALDLILTEEIGKRFGGRSISVHDMAASSAITSVDLYHRLGAVGPVQLRASDYYDAVFFVGSIVLDVEGRPMKRNLLSSLATFAHRLGLSSRASLFHPAARSLAEADPNFQLAKESFFSPGPARYDVVRVMNALNLQNFSSDQIHAALRAIMPTVNDGGLLVLGRCDDNDNHIQATIFAKGGGKFSVLRHLASGYALASSVVGAT